MDPVDRVRRLVLDQVLRRLLDGGGQCYTAFDSALLQGGEHV